jgi:hypothetical protein
MPTDAGGGFWVHPNLPDGDVASVDQRTRATKTAIEPDGSAVNLIIATV